MPTTRASKPEPSFADALTAYDRVKLNKAVTTEGKALGSGLTGTIVLCHGTIAYEVEFDGISDFFAIQAEDLAKI